MNELLKDTSKLTDELLKAETILLFPHVGIDGDAVGSCCALIWALRKKGKRTYPCTDKQHGRAVLASSNASTTTYASSSIHTLFCLVMRNKDIVGILCRTGADRNETAGLKNLVKRRTVNNKVLDYRET